MRRRTGSVLVVYALLQFPLRTSQQDHLYALRRHSSFATSYLNLSVRDVPRWVARKRFDAVVFHTSFLSGRWDPPTFERLWERARPLFQLDAPRLAMPQDEFIHTTALTDFLREAEVGDVLSVAPESEWPKIYSGLDLSRVRMHQVLTGYLEEETLKRIEAALEPPRPRDIAIGYRSWEAAMWLGRHGRLKVEVAEAFRRAAGRRGLRVDISTRDEDTIAGDAWYQFLGGCRYTVGVEGGSSILDRDGSLKAATEAYLAQHPNAGFDDVEAACFRGLDGSLRLRSASPRHLEACATRTCQVLVEGEYNGILRPGEHYLPVREDLSNVDELIEVIAADRHRDEIVEAAHRDVVASRRFTYQSFAGLVDRVIEARSGPSSSGRLSPVESALRGAQDRVSWLRVRRRLRPLTVPQRIKVYAMDRLPSPLAERLRRAKRWASSFRGK
jgi:hypothetical protein